MSNHHLTLSAEDVAALRSMAGKERTARHVLVADWRINHGYALTVIETITMPEGFEPRTFERRHRFEVNGRSERYVEFASHCPRMVASGDSFGPTTARALANLVKVGDMVYVRFYVGNDTTPMTEAGFHHDQCHIEVWRGKDPEKAKLIAVMPLDDRVYRDDARQGGSMCDFSYKPERDGNAA